jgi:hypothetical protein
MPDSSGIDRYAGIRRASGATGSRRAARWTLARQLSNERSQGWWSQLNRVAKLRVDRATKRRGARTKGGFRTYDLELQGRDVWHLHIVLGMETPIERAWAFEYVRGLRELGARCGSGWVDAKPGSLEVSVTVKSARRTLLTYVSRKLTARPVGGGSPGRPHGRRRGPPPRGGRRRAGATR